jgi:hypothetical protein
VSDGATKPVPEQTTSPRPDGATTPALRLKVTSGRTLRLRRIGTGFLAGSAAPFGLMVFGLVRYFGEARELKQIHADLQLDPLSHSASEIARHYDRGVLFRALAITGGVTGALMLYTGASLFAYSKYRDRQLRSSVSLTPSPRGLVLHGSF